MLELNLLKRVHLYLISVIRVEAREAGVPEAERAVEYVLFNPIDLGLFDLYLGETKRALLAIRTI